MKREVLILLWSCIIIGLTVRFHGLAERSLWVDEFFTLFQATGHGMDIDAKLSGTAADKKIELSRAGDFRALLKNDPSRSFNDVTRGVLTTDTHPPLYFLLMHAWLNMFGEGSGSIRSFSLLAGILSIFMFYLVASRLFDRESGYFCAMFACISGFAVRYSQEARSYSLIMLIGLVSLLFLIRFEKYKRNPDLFMYFVFTCLGLYTHYFYIFTIIAHFLYFSVVHRNDKKLLLKFYLAFLAGLVVFSPLLTRIISGTYNFSRAEWIFGYPGSLDKLYYFIGGVLRFVNVVPVTGVINSILAIVSACLFCCMAFIALEKNAEKYTRQLFLVFCILAVPLLIMLAVDFVQHGALLRQERFWMFPFLGFVLFSGFVLRNFFPVNRLVVYVFMLSMVISLAGLGHLRFGPEPKEASMWITKKAGDNPAGVIVYSLRSTVAAQAYYLPDSMYFIPVPGAGRMQEAFDRLRESGAQRVFVCIYYHHTDPSLMNQDFMEAPEHVSGFKLGEVLKKNDIKIKEYLLDRQCAS